MTMVSTGPISLGGTATTGGLNQSVNVELGRSGTATINMNESGVRSLAGVPSGQISMNNFYGKSNAFSLTATISSNTQNYNLLTAMQAAGYVNGSAYTVNLTINSGVYVWSDSTSLAGFDTGAITGTGTINLINNGFIMGRGGNGGTAAAGSSGGPAMNLQKSITVTNNSFIAGGGGGGGGTAVSFTNSTGGGGGAGGGIGGNGGTATGGAGGGPGSQGSVGNIATVANGGAGGGGGGRILPGVGGASRTSPTTTTLGGNGGGAGGSGGLIYRPFPPNPMIPFYQLSGGGGCW